MGKNSHLTTGAVSDEKEGSPVMRWGDGDNGGGCLLKKDRYDFRQT